ncbi:MAG: glyoxalase [Ignavibacteriae bacterium HGW-Ignavibacteriae-4]|jgi:predicted lactoylglutathione lyase|nr:MAG: glyoxalase [Ignavibacteriae bacterium HGW-Ignavibacteriae-4]
MDLGAFSVSLSVKNLAVSKEFYEKLGFSEMGGGMEMNYLIMKNGTTLIGLFQGMFDGNILTFNPGWDSVGEKKDPYEDIREIQKKIKSSGITMVNEVDESGEGPANFILTDPDGNVLLFDQHR